MRYFAFTTPKSYAPKTSFKIELNSLHFWKGNKSIKSLTEENIKHLLQTFEQTGRCIVDLDNHQIHASESAKFPWEDSVSRVEGSQGRVLYSTCTEEEWSQIDIMEVQ